MNPVNWRLLAAGVLGGAIGGLLLSLPGVRLYIQSEGQYFGQFLPMLQAGLGYLAGVTLGAWLTVRVVGQTGSLWKSGLGVLCAAILIVSLGQLLFALGLVGLSIFISVPPIFATLALILRRSVSDGQPSPGRPRPRR